MEKKTYNKHEIVCIQLRQEAKEAKNDATKKLIEESVEELEYINKVLDWADKVESGEIEVTK